MLVHPPRPACAHRGASLLSTHSRFFRTVRWNPRVEALVALCGVLGVSLCLLTGCEDDPGLLASGRGNTIAADAGTTPPGALHPASAGACASCHGAIFNQWSASMHAQASTSPVVVVQTNQVARGPLAESAIPDPKNLCVNCHAPSAAALAPSPTFPLTGNLSHEGITCVSCHKWNGTPTSGSGGLVSFQAGFQSTNVMFGTLANPVGARTHASGAWGEVKDSSDLCATCHDVSFDRDGDGKIVKGTDLVLQTTSREYKKYREDGGARTCIACHMPSLANGRAADTARIPEDQLTEAPPRALHDHGFVGVDAPLEPSQADTQANARAQLLRSAAKVTIDSASAYGGTVDLDVSIANVGTGHNLPTGFAFARQMWLEIVVTRANGAIVDASGLLSNEANDLCDASTYENERAMRPFFVGCTASDPQLVSFQQKLVDRVEVVRGGGVDDLGDPRLAQSGSETVLQQLPGGAVPRVRPSDNQPLGTIVAGDTRRFSYTMRGSIAPGEEVKISARLLFRPLPPYFVRALAATQSADDRPQLAQTASRLRVVEMATATRAARRE